MADAGKNRSLIDPIYQKYVRSVVRALGSSEFYRFFMDSISKADNEFQFSNRKVEKTVDLTWVDAVEESLEGFQNIISMPRNVIQEEELIVNVANARKAGADTVRHLAQHASLVEDFNERTGDVRPSHLMQKYREDSVALYENRLVYTAMESAYHFVKIRHDALFSAMSDEFGAKLKLRSDMDSATEHMHLDMYVQYTLPTDCTAAEMTQAGTGFPKGTRFSTDNGVSYSVLCEDRPIPVTGSQSLLVDMSGVSSWSGDRMLRLTANGKDGRVFTDTLALTAKSWGGNTAVTYTEDGLPTMQIQPWNSGCLQITAAVEWLARVEEPVMTEGQEDVSQQQTQSIVKYVSADDVVQIEWTPAVEGEAAATEGNSPADATETQTLMLLPAEGISRVPAGTYRVTICWKCNDVLVAERVIPFFVTR